MAIHSRPIMAFIAAGVLVFGGCKGSGGSSPTGPSSGANTVTVNIVASTGSQAYKPNPVAAGTGFTVVFKNNDTALHHIVLNDGSDLGDVAPGATSSGYAVKNASPLTFQCKIHTSMVGSLNGTSVPEPVPCPDPNGYGC